MITSDGRAFSVRRALPGDAEALAAMFDRCSPDTRYRRFHAPVTAIPAAYLRECLDAGPYGQRAFVAEAPAGPPGDLTAAVGGAGPMPGEAREAGLVAEDGRQRQGAGRAVFAGATRLVAFGSAGAVRDEPRVFEAALLVEDGWQRQGVGRAVFAEILAGARREGAELIRLVLCRAQPSLIAYMFAHAQAVVWQTDGCDVTVDLAMPVPATAPAPADQAGARLTRPRRPAAGRAR